MTAKSAPATEPVPPAVVRALGNLVLGIIAREGRRDAHGSLVGLLTQLLPHDQAALLADWLQAPAPTAKA